MLEVDGLSGPASHAGAWGFIVGTVLLTGMIDMPKRRLINPVNPALWLFGLSTAAWMGAWGAVEIYLGLLCLVGSQAAIVLVSAARLRRPTAAMIESETSAEHEVDEAPPLRLVHGEEAGEERGGFVVPASSLRRSA